MAFGKRVTPPKGKDPATAGLAGTADMVRANAVSRTAELAPSTPAERCQALRDRMLGLLDQSGRIAAAVRDDGGIDMPGMDEEIDPLGPPLAVRGFDENFTFIENGVRAHSVYVYVDVPYLGTPDPNAQFHLQLLVGRIQELNRYCQQAVKDDALRVALQSPKLPPLIDRIVVGTAFFASFFENAELALPYISANPMRAMPPADIARLRETMERHRLMAFDKMIAPHTLEEMLPTRKWPHVGAETRWTSHAGERFINGVYFPAEQARPIVAAAEARSASLLPAMA